MGQTAAVSAFLVLLVAGSLASLQQPETSLRLDDAIRIALANNHRLGISQAAVAEAEAVVEEAEASRLPRLEVAGGLQRTDNPVQVFGNLLRQGRFAQENFALDSLNEPAPLDNYNARLSVSQELWSSGRRAGAIAAAAAGHAAAASQYGRTRQEVIYQVIDAYGAAVVAALELEVAHEALETARAHVGLAEDLFAGGLTVESDLLQARVRESEVQESLIRAESGVEVTRAALNLAMGRPLATAMVLPAQLEPVSGVGQAPALAPLIERATAQRRDLAAARSRSQAARAGVRVARAGRLPEIGLEGNLETNSEDFFDTQGENWSLMLGLRLRPFDGFATRARVRQARQRQLGAERRAALLEQSIALEVRQAFWARRSAAQRLAEAGLAVELAERSLAIVEDRYREGLTTLPELLDAQIALTRGRLREVAARRDLLVSRAGLDLATGDL